MAATPRATVASGPFRAFGEARGDLRPRTRQRRAHGRAVHPVPPPYTLPWAAAAMDTRTPRPPLGLIAGEGVFPVLVARGERAAGRRVVCAGFAGSVWPTLRDEVDEFRTFSVARVNGWMRFVADRGCREAIVVGRVTKGAAHDPLWFVRYIPDWRTTKIVWRLLRHDRRPQTFIDMVIRELASDGVTVIDSTTYCADHLTAPGVLTRRQPTDAQRADAAFGWDLCRRISRMDIGQAIAVHHRTVVAVEALEGTNAMIERAGQLCRRGGGWTLIKVANTSQDLRIDVPTVGTTTIEKLAAAGCGCLVLEAGKTIMLEKPKVLDLADRHKIAVVGVDDDLKMSFGIGH